MQSDGGLGGLTRAMQRRGSKDRGPLREFLAFKLATELFGVEISRIGAILRLPPITPVPRAPDGVMGVAGVRGRVLTIVDLRHRLHLPVAPPTKLSRILLLPSVDRDPVGMYVDEVQQVYRLADSEIEYSADILGTEIGEHVIGIGRREDNLLVLLDIEPILRSGHVR